MTNGASRHVPQHPHWDEDLPGRNAPAHRLPKMVNGDLNTLNDVYMEVSRASTLMRGVGILFGTAGGFGFILILGFLAYMLFPIEEGSALLVLIWLGMLFFGISATYLMLKTDIAIPRDRPVRFNRCRRKVFVYEHAYGMNPFVDWPVAAKIFDWETLSAEIHRQAGFSGKTYVQRFSLWIVSCEPGTNEVVDRFELKGNSPTTEELHDAWAYCRQYMEHGSAELPVYPLRRQGISFRRSFFEYLRFLDPTDEGREVRKRMTVGDWAFNVPFVALTFWILIPTGVGHYIAMRLAPDAKWPPEIDAESRSSQYDPGKSMNRSAEISRSPGSA